MNYCIYRHRPPGLERSVRITDCYGNMYTMDPQAMIQEATGVLYDRYHCILSFANGMKSHGHQISFRTGQPKDHSPVFGHALDRAVPIYSFTGLMWISGLWPDLLDAMHRSVIPDQRWNVYKRTADHYFKQWHPSEIHWIL